MYFFTENAPKLDNLAQNPYEIALFAPKMHSKLQKMEGIPATGISVREQNDCLYSCTPSGFCVHKLLQEKDSFKQLPRKCSQAVDIKVYKSSGSNTYPFIAMSSSNIKYYKFSFQCAYMLQVFKRCFQFQVSFSTELVLYFQAMVNLGRSLNCQSFHCYLQRAFG